MIIYGAGGFGREVRADFGSNGVQFADDELWPPEQWPDGSNFIVAVGDPKKREEMTRRALAYRHRLVSHVSKRATCRVDIGEGSMIMPGAVLTIDIRVGRGVLVNIGATVGHDCVLDDFCSIQPGANLTGRVHVGKRAYIGIGATLICRGEKLIIGDDAVVGGGSVVLHHVPAGQTVVGNPAKPLPPSPPDLSYVPFGAPYK